MFSTLIRQQIHFASSARLSSPLTRQLLCGLPKVAQKSHVLSQRTFSISRSLSEQADAPERPRPSFLDAKPPRPRRPLNAEKKKKALYIGNMPFTTTEAEIRELFEPYGQIKRISLTSDESGRLTGYGFVEYENLEDAVAAAESGAEEPYVLHNRPLLVSYARNTSISQEEPKPNTTIHIPNFPLPGDEARVRQLLKDYEGHILRVNFMKNMHGEETGKVFVQFSDQETATAAYDALRDYDFEGTPLKTHYARNRFPPRASKMADFDA